MIRLCTTIATYFYTGRTTANLPSETCEECPKATVDTCLSNRRLDPAPFPSYESASLCADQDVTASRTGEILFSHLSFVKITFQFVPKVPPGTCSTFYSQLYFVSKESGDFSPKFKGNFLC